MQQEFIQRSKQVSQQTSSPDPSQQPQDGLQHFDRAGSRHQLLLDDSAHHQPSASTGAEDSSTVSRAASQSIRQLDGSGLSLAASIHTRGQSVAHGKRDAESENASLSSPPRTLHGFKVIKSINGGSGISLPKLPDGKQSRNHYAFHPDQASRDSIVGF